MLKDITFCHPEVDGNIIVCLSAPERDGVDVLSEGLWLLRSLCGDKAFGGSTIRRETHHCIYLQRWVETVDTSSVIFSSHTQDSKT